MPSRRSRKTRSHGKSKKGAFAGGAKRRTRRSKHADAGSKGSKKVRRSGKTKSRRSGKSRK